MNKLYPPYIEGTIPAFCDSQKGTVLTVPFSMNRAVGKGEVSAFYLKMKTLQSDKYFITLKSSNYDLENQVIYFDLTANKDKLNIGQFYKIQIAYVGSDKDSTVGYYSSVGVVKYTSRPNVYIQNLNRNIINKHSYNYLGCYSQESSGEKDIKDYSEKAYSYKFIIYDKNGAIITDTGWILHNNSKDINSYESQDEFLYLIDFEANQNYYIVYKVITNNGLEISSPKYRIASKKSIQPNIKTKPIPELNFENGFVNISLDKSNYYNEKTGTESAVSGSFVLSRKTSDGPWEEILRFSLMGEFLSRWNWKDFTVEQGKEYIYSIQEYNDYDLYSERVISNSIYVDFEDSFLFDGEKQLRIRFNPKVSSFKTDLLENKVDTIGNKYPFIFRNGNVSYKEFPISGLISYWMDSEKLFWDEKHFTHINLERDKTKTENKQIEFRVKTTNLSGYNFSAERDFKLLVLDWLNDGKPKLFRSPSEGNYIVRLMNVSLTPDDKINRLIHTFNATAYEVAEHNYENLNKHNFISISEPNTLKTRWMTVELFKKSSLTGTDKIELLEHKRANSVYFYDMRPGEIVYINNKSIMIGQTGIYSINNGEEITSIQIPSGIIYNGQMTYSFEDTSKNTFNEILTADSVDVVAQQIIGEHNNIINLIEDVKIKLSNFYYLNFYKRDVLNAYPQKVVEGATSKIVLYEDPQCTIKINEENPLFTYRYELSEIMIETNHGNLLSTGFEPADTGLWNSEPGKITEEYFLLNKYYIKKDGKYVLANSFNPDDFYYIKKNYEFYYDPMNSDIMYISKESYNRIYEEFKKIYRDIKIIYPRVYLNEFSIDGSQVELEEDNDFEVKTPSIFNEIKIGAGIYLNCGYQFQRVEYLYEKDILNYQELKTLNKILISSYKDYKTTEFNDLLSIVNINFNQSYNKIIEEAQKQYNEKYIEYTEKLEQTLKEQEAIK